MTATQDIIFGVTGQTLTFDAPEGRPSAVTSVTVYEASAGDDDTAELATSGSATVETNPNTTLDATSGFGETNTRLVNLTATTGCAVGRRYLLTGTTGIKEWIEVSEIASGVSVTARAPLMSSHATASTFESTRMSIAVDATWVADDDNLLADSSPNPSYRIRWVYVVAGITHVADTYFDLVRYGGRHTVTPEDMSAILPSWLEQLPTDHRGDQGARIIDEGYNQVKADLYAAGYADETIREREIIDELVRLKSIWLLQQSRYLSGAQLLDVVEYSAQQYQSRVDAWIRHTLKVPVDTDNSGAGSHPVPCKIWSR